MKVEILRGDLDGSHFRGEGVVRQIEAEARMFGRLPAHGLHIRRAKGIRFRNIEIIADVPDPRPAIVCDDVTDITIADFESTSSNPVAQTLCLRRRASRHAGAGLQFWIRGPAQRASPPACGSALGSTSRGKRRLLFVVRTCYRVPGR